MYRVAVVDDHPIARQGIAATFTGVADLDVTATVADPDQLDPALPYDVVTLDLYLNPTAVAPTATDGGPCLAVIARLAASVPVLVVSASQTPDDVLSAIRAGAMGYVTKSSPTEFLVSAARLAASGGFAFSPDLARVVQRAFSPRLDRTQELGQGYQNLSPREIETLRLVARGLTHHQVATRMAVSKSTVDTYVERIRQKLKVGNKAELTRLAMSAFDNLDDTPPGS